MISFTIALIALVIGYFTYGSFVERIFKPDSNRKTPAITHADGVDYIPLPTWKIFMIQFLNIAGLGPIFGAIMGAKFGTASFLWIVFGCIFAGATHDYLSGMLSVRHDGESLPDTIGRYLGLPTKQIMRIFSVVLLVLLGCVFVAGPAKLLAGLTPGGFGDFFWIIVVFIYYIVATLLPVDKIIGKIYPLFAAALIFMAIGIMVMLYYYHPALPEVWDTLKNTHPDAEHMPIFPMMFVSIACGAISGFHGTQSPLMARCMTNEKHGRPIFYGAMITEGIVALIWAAAATYFFKNGDALGTAGYHEDQAAVVVKFMTEHWLGTWRYFSWSNQTLSVFTLWACTVFLHQTGKPWMLTIIPALFMTSVCSTYICVAPEGFQMSQPLSYSIGGVATLISLIAFILYYRRFEKNKKSVVS